MKAVFCAVLWFLATCKQPAPPAPALALDTFIGPPAPAASCTATPDGTGNFILSPTCTSADIFVNAAAGDFRLVAGSPAIGNALCLPEVPTDADGNPRPTPGRPAGAGCDIGAFQYVGAQPITAPTNLRVTQP